MKPGKIISEKEYILKREFNRKNKTEDLSPPVFIDTKKMEQEVPDGITFAAHMTIESHKALEFMVNCIEFCPDRNQNKAGYVIKNFTEQEKVKQLIYFFADDKYTCRRIDKLFRVKLPWKKIDNAL